MQNKIYRSVTLKTPVSDNEILSCIKNHLEFRKKDRAVVEVNIVGKAKMQSLNREFMNHNYPTDVLSFPVADFPKLSDCDFIGTVVLCNDIIQKQAEKLGKTFTEELLFYLRHGIDHLVGIHHK
jgi:probable rRNA maturation factor